MHFRNFLFFLITCLLVPTAAQGQTNLVTLDPDPGTDPLNTPWYGGDWNTDGDPGGWTTGNITGATISGGVLSGTASSTEPTVSLTGITGGPDFDLGYNDFLDLRLKLPVDYAGEVKIYYGVVNGGYADGDPGPRNLTGFDASRCFTIPNASLAKDGATHVYRVNLSLEIWCRGQLNDLRIVPATISGTAFEIDYVRIGDTGPTLGIKDYDSASAPFTFQSKNFIFGWNQASIDFVGMNVAWAKLNLRNAEEMYAHNVYRLNYPRPRWQEAGGPYKLNFYCTYGGNYSNTWTWLSVSYYQLRTDPPTWTTQHELTHAFQGRLSSGHVPGDYYEMHANYGVELWLEHYQQLFPGQSDFQPAILSQMHFNNPIGINYYETWQFMFYLENNPDNLPGLGLGTVRDIWQQMQAGETIHQTLKRIRPSLSIKDLIGYYARRGLNYNYPGHPQFKTNVPSIVEWDQLTEPIRRPDNPDWWQVPHQRAPMQSGFTIHELAPSGTGAGRVVSVELKGLLDEGGQADWRASFIVVNDSGQERLNPLFGNNQTGSVTLAADENKVYLVVAATPENYELYRFDEPNFPYRSTPSKRRFHYEFKITGATPRERNNGPTTDLVQHANGGGWKAGTATVASTAYIGPNARVLDTAQVLGNARVEDFAVVQDSARLQDNAIARGHASVSGNSVMTGRAIVTDFARLAGSATMAGSARLLEHATLTGGVLTDQSVMKGSSGSWGGTFSGNSIADGDYGFGRNIRNATIFGHLPWVGIPENWLVPIPTGVYACYEFSSASERLAFDTYAATNGILRGTPAWLSTDSGRNGVLTLNGTDQWIQLERSTVELSGLSLTTWVKWNGGAANQTLFHFGDGNAKFVSFTPSNGSGFAELRASDGTNTYSIHAASALPVGIWCQVAVSLDGSTGKFSINGSAAGSGSLPLRPYQFLPPNTASNPAHNFIGRGTAGNFFSGSLDDFKLYSVATPTFLIVSADTPEPNLPENAPSGIVRFTRTSLTGSSTSGNLTINYTLSGTATSGVDYVTPSGTIVIPDGQSYVDLEIAPIHDTLSEGTETITVTMTASPDFANHGIGNATLNLQNIGDLSSALLAHYRFDESGGTTANDSSGNNNTATLSGGATWNTAELALTLDGTSGYAQTPVSGGSTRTLAAWIRPHNAATWASDANVFNAHLAGQWGTGWGVRNGQIFVMLDDQSYDSGVTISSNVWQHVALTFDKTQSRIYVNGELRHTHTYVQGGVTGATYRIGHSSNNDFASVYFDGDIRDARIFDRVIYTDEAMEIYMADAPLLAPRNLTASAGQGFITLGWQSAGSGETSYTLRRATNSGGPFVTIAGGLTTMSFSDTAVANGTAYYYVVAASNSGGTGPDSNVASATPSSTAGLPPPWQQGNIGNAAAGPTTVFNNGLVAVNGAGSRITSGVRTDNFRFVYIPVIGDCTVTAKVEQIGSTNSAAKAGVMIRETLVNNARHASTLISPAASSNRQFVRRATTNNNSAVNSVTSSHFWVRITRAGTSFSAFTSPDGTDWTQLGTNQTVGMSTTATVYAGLAVCSGDNAVLSNAVFSNVSITGGYPTGLTATAGNAQVTLSWNTVAGATSYRVKRATTAGGAYTLVSSPTTNTFIDAGLTNGTTYYYVISAHNGTSESANSSEVFATPSAPLPATPSNLAASDGGNQVSLAWNSAANATSYRVKRASSPDGPFITIGSATGTSFTDTPVPADANYFYTVTGLNASNEEGLPSTVAQVVRVLHFDPNGSSAGSVADGGSYPWLAANWSTASGGALVTQSWQSGPEARFAATSPGAPLSYAVDLTNYNTAPHGHFRGIRALAGTVTFTGNVSNFYLNSPVTITADPGAAILFAQTRTGADVQAFNLNGQTATFHGEITVNSAGIGNNGSIIVGSGHLKLGNAIANYSPASTVLQAGATLTNTGDAGKSFNLGALTMNGATLAATNAGHTSWGNYVLSNGLTIGGTSMSEISADIRCNANTTQTLNIGETGQDVDLIISGRIGHPNWVAWAYATKTGPGTLKVSGTNGLGGLTVNSGTLILEGAPAIAGMDVSSLTNNNASVIFSVLTGTVSYPRALQGNGLFTKSGAGILELTATTVHGGNHRVQEGILRMTQARFGDASSITIDSGAQIDLAFAGRDTIGALVVNGVTLPPGIYSASTHPAYLTGTGSLKVAASTILAWDNSAGTGIWNGSDANWTSQSWQNLADALISHTNAAQTITLNGSLNAADVHIGNGSNNANYTLAGSAGSNLSALAFNVQGNGSNDPGLGSATLSNLNAQIASDLRVGRWDLVIGGGSNVNIGGQLRSTSDGSGAGDWGRVTLQDSANVTATGGVNGAGSVWGLTLNGGTLTTPSIRAAENGLGAGARLTLNGTTIRATQPTGNFITVDSTNRAYLGTNGARFDTNGNDITVGVQMVDTAGQAGSLTKLGSGMLTVTNANTFTGPVAVDGGTLYASLGNAASNRAFSYTSGINVNNGGTLRSSANGLFGWDGSQAKPITIHAGGMATTDAGGDVNVGLVTLNGGTLAGGPSAAWGSWSFGRGASKQLAVTENSTVSATDVALFGGSTVDVAAGKTLSFTGTIVNTSNGASALIKTGAGTIQLSGNNTYTGATILRGGRLQLIGSIVAGGDLVVADAGVGALLSNTGTLNRNAITLGTATNSVGGLTQSAGSSTATFLHLGLTPGSYGALKVDGGTFTVNGDANVGSWGSGYQTGGGLGGLVDISSGTVNVTGWITMSRWGATQDAVLHVSGGNLTYAGGGLVGNWNADGADTSIITVSGNGSIATTNNTVINLSNNSSAANTGILNLNGGTVTPARVIGGRGFVNFNGGTLRAYSDQTDFLAIASAFVHSGGAVIDSNDKAITIGQALRAPTGSGVSSVAVIDGGSGYTCAPVVKIDGGTSSVPATAIANIVDDGTGNGTFKIASLTITSPGVYTGAPTAVALIGGGSATPATFATPVLAANASGSLTKNGTGTLTLTANNTYTGGTIVNAGTLTLSGSSATLGAGDLTVASGATCAIGNPNGAVANTAAVYLSGTAKLDLASGVNETVRFLHLNGVLQSAGTYTAANLPAHLSGTGSLIVTEGAAALTPAEIWRNAHFNTTANAGDAADDADPDADGTNNLLERALGTDPLAFDHSGKPSIDANSPDFSFTFTRSKAATDLDLVVDLSPDLQSSTWIEALLAPDPGADGMISIIDDTRSDVQVLRFTATTNANRMFYRLRVKR